MADEHQQAGRKGPSTLYVRVRRAGLTLLVLAITVGAVVLAYDLGFQQGAKHAPPLITADLSPTKMPPKAPGGIEIPHQDKLVYQRLSTTRAPAETTAETLLPLPEEPLPKPPREVPAQLAAVATIVTNAEPAAGTLAPVTQTTETNTASTEVEASARPPSPAAPSGAQQVLKSVNAAVAATESEPQTKQADPPPPPALASAAPALAKPSEKAATLTRSIASPPLPTPAKATLPAAKSANETLAKLSPAPPPKAPAPIPALKAPPINAIYLVQVGSFRSDEAAQVGWRRLAKRHSEILDRMPHRVAKADLGAAKGIYYRLQVGAFNSRARADELCRKLKAQRQDCLIVKR